MLSPTSESSDYTASPTTETTRYPSTRSTHKRETSFGGGHVTRHASTSESEWSLPDQPRAPTRKASQSTLTPPVRAFPRPPADMNWTPSIRAGSVRSVSLERGIDDDGASRRSVRSFRATVTKNRPPLPHMASHDSLLPTMVQAIESSLGSNAITGGTGSSSNGGASGSEGAGQAKRAAPSSSATTHPKPHRDSRPDKAAASASQAAHHKARSGETADRVTALNGSGQAQSSQSNGHDGVGVIGSFDKRLNRSVMSLGVKAKAEKVVDADPQPRLASLYLVTGLFKVSCSVGRAPFPLRAHGD